MRDAIMLPLTVSSRLSESSPRWVQQVRCKPFTAVQIDAASMAPPPACALDHNMKLGRNLLGQHVGSSQHHLSQ